MSSTLLLIYIWHIHVLQIFIFIFIFFFDIFMCNKFVYKFLYESLICSCVLHWDINSYIHLWYIHVYQIYTFICIFLSKNCRYHLIPSSIYKLSISYNKLSGIGPSIKDVDVVQRLLHALVFSRLFHPPKVKEHHHHCHNNYLPKSNAINRQKILPILSFQ